MLGLSRPGLSNLDCFHSDIQASSLCDDNQHNTADNLDVYAREYTTTLLALLDWHVPLKTRKRVTRPALPWYNEIIGNTKRERKKAELKRRKIKAVSDLLRPMQEFCRGDANQSFWDQPWRHFITTFSFSGQYEK